MSDGNKLGSVTALIGGQRSEQTEQTFGRRFADVLEKLLRCYIARVDSGSVLE
jgi:hypothetical protein